jgi:hypothetical protein
MAARRITRKLLADGGHDAGDLVVWLHKFVKLDLSVAVAILPDGAG